MVTFKNIDTEEIFEISEEKRVLKVCYLDMFGQQITSEATLVAEKDENGEPIIERLHTKNWKVVLPKDISQDDS